jgi:hypothetical protein
MFIQPILYPHIIGLPSLSYADLFDPLSSYTEEKLCKMTFNISSYYKYRLYLSHLRHNNNPSPSQITHIPLAMVYLAEVLSLLLV